MEPKNSRAGRALSLIMQKMPVRWEPVLGIVRASNEQQLHDYWKAIAEHWGQLQKRGAIKSFSTPYALALSPQNIERNRRRLAAVDFNASRTALQSALAQTRFSTAAFASAFQFLEQLRVAAARDYQIEPWRRELPESSAWWFLIDRYFGQDPLLTTGFVTTNQPVSTQQQKNDLARDLPIAGIPITLSVCTYALTDLLSWPH